MGEQVSWSQTWFKRCTAMIHILKATKTSINEVGTNYSLRLTTHFTLLLLTSAERESRRAGPTLGVFCKWLDLHRACSSCSELRRAGMASVLSPDPRVHPFCVLLSRSLEQANLHVACMTTCNKPCLWSPAVSYIYSWVGFAPGAFTCWRPISCS